MFCKPEPFTAAIVLHCLWHTQLNLLITMTVELPSGKYDVHFLTLKLVACEGSLNIYEDPFKRLEKKIKM